MSISFFDLIVVSSDDPRREMESRMECCAGSEDSSCKPDRFSSAVYLERKGLESLEANQTSLYHEFSLNFSFSTISVILGYKQERGK